MTCTEQPARRALAEFIEEFLLYSLMRDSSVRHTEARRLSDCRAANCRVRKKVEGDATARFRLAIGGAAQVRTRGGRAVSALGPGPPLVTGRGAF